MGIKTAIIADDFTGAGDSSIYFSLRGYGRTMSNILITGETGT